MEEGKEYGVFSGEDIFNYRNEKLPIIEHILYDRDCMWIDGKAGEGKSLIALTLICNLTTGTPFLDTYEIDKPRKVLYVQTEGDRAETLERLHLITAKLPINNNNWVHMNWDGLMLNTEEGYAQFMSMARKPGLHYDVIILDPLYTTVKGSLSNDDVVTDWIRNMRRVRKEYDCAMLVLGHEGKEGFNNGVPIPKSASNLFGSVYWGAFVNQNFKLSAKDGVLTLKRGKQRSSKIVESMEMKIVSTDDFLWLTNKEEFSNTTSAIIYNFIRNEGKPISVKTLFSKSAIPESTVHRIVAKLVGEKLIERIKVSRAFYYQPLSKGDEK